MTKKLSLSLHILDESGSTFLETSSDVSVNKIVSEIFRNMDTPLRPDQVMVFVGRAVPLDKSLLEVGTQNADSLFIVAVNPLAASVRLQLFLPRTVSPWREISQTPAVLGRYDETMLDERLDIDLSEILPEGKKNNISRRQAEFVEQNGQWYVRLHPKAASSLFVNNVQLTPQQLVALAENDVISMGTSPTQPVAQLIVRFEGS